MKLRHAALAALIGLVAGPFASAVVAAGPVAESTVAVFSHEDFTDVDEEDANVIDDLEAGGHTVVLIEDITPEAFTAGLDGAQVLVIPEVDGGELIGALGDEAESVISGFVDGGGRILFFGSGDPTPEMNGLFGFSLVHLEEFCVPEEEQGEITAAAVGDCVLTEAAAVTEMADGPADLAYVDDSTALDPASLPTGSTVFYEDSDTGLVASASMPFGDGAVLFYGWDWFPEADEEGDAGVAGVEEEAEWATVLDLGVSQPEVTADSPAAGALRLRSDSPSTQPVFVALVIDGTAHTVVIAAKTTEANFDVGGAASVAWSVPGWGIGEGTVDVAGAAAAPPAAPAPVAPTFTG